MRKAEHGVTVERTDRREEKGIRKKRGKEIKVRKVYHFIRFFFFMCC